MTVEKKTLNRIKRNEKESKANQPESILFSSSAIVQGLKVQKFRVRPCKIRKKKQIMRVAGKQRTATKNF